MPKTIYTKEYDRFLELMVQARKTSGITQAELAKKLKRPQSFVSKYENGERRLDIIEFIHVCKTLKSDPKAILSRII